MHGERSALGICGVYRAMVGDVVDGLADLDEVYARFAGRTGSAATQGRALRAATLAMVGRTDDARLAFAEIRGELVAELNASEADADALISAWLDGRVVDADALARLERVGGDKLWVHGQLLRVTGRV